MILTKLTRIGFKTVNQVQIPPPKHSGIKRRIEKFKRRNIFNISSIESLGPTQELGLKGGFETNSMQIVSHHDHIKDMSIFTSGYP
jgi:hypothetical protein